MHPPESTRHDTGNTPLPLNPEPKSIAPTPVPVPLAASHRLAGTPWLVAGVVAVHALVIAGAWQHSQTLDRPAPPRFAGTDQPAEVRRETAVAAREAAPLGADEADRTATAPAPPITPEELNGQRPSMRLAMAGGLPALDASELLARAIDAAGVGAEPATGADSPTGALSDAAPPTMPAPPQAQAQAQPQAPAPPPAPATAPAAAVATQVADLPSASNSSAINPPAASGTAASRSEAASASPVADADTPPVYRTQPPDAARLQFSLRRGSITGRGELNWQPEGDRYGLVLRGTVLGITAITQDSRGALGATGLQPEQFIDTRRGREALTARFDRDAGLIRFSRAPHTHPLSPGAQDRLSWMLQLPSILRAEPALREPGSELSVFVAGARGDGDIWQFVAIGREPLQTNAGAIPQAEHWQRLPRSEGGTRVDVWFDPQQQWLPVRVRMQSDGESFELMLERIERG